MASLPAPARASEPAPRVRKRILDAAERLFAARGYEAASVREITAAAGCNVAGVSYYFGGKERLYEEVFRRLLEGFRRQRLEAIRAAMEGPEASLEGLLSAFASAFVEPLARPPRGPQLLRLLGREMLEQRLPADLFVEEIIAPVQSALMEALLRLSPGLAEDVARWCAHSLVGQLFWQLNTWQRFGGIDHPATRFDLSRALERSVVGAAATLRALAAREAEPASEGGAE